MYEVIVDLSRKLRSMGVKTSVAESIDACQAVSIVGADDYERVKTAIKVTMIKDFSKYGIFEQLLEETMERYAESGTGDEEGAEGSSRDEGATKSGVKSGSETGQADKNQSANVGMVMYSPLEVLNKRVIKLIEVEKLREGKRIIKRMRRRLAILPGRRSKVSKKGEIDFVRTFRKSLSTSGEIIEFKKVSKIKSRARLVTFIDISGSMDSYTDWLVRAMFLLRRFSRRVEVFVFSTRLMKITDVTSCTSAEEMCKMLYERVDLWGSGTRIGHSLRMFLENFGNLIDKTWVVLIISDGWDTGEPELLKRSMEALKLKAGRIVWLNPHADKPNFKPMTIGMMTAMPYIDLLAGTNVLEDYSAFIRAFGKSIKPMKINHGPINVTV